MPNLSKTTKDHDVIRNWAEERGAKPSHVKRTGSAEDVGVLRLDFPGYTGEDTLEPITWEQFFEKFDERNLALVYEDETSGGQKSNFNKIISAESAEDAGRQQGRKATGRGGRRSPAQQQGGVTASKRAATTAAKKKAPAKSAPAAKKAAGAKKSAGMGRFGATKKAAKSPFRPAAKKAGVRKSAARKVAAKKVSSKKVASKKTSAKTASKKSPFRSGAKKAPAKKSARGRRR